jgi:glycosyltransferase involved in cell wall biosynthesis
VRLGVYTDYVYRRDRDGAYGERAFVLFQCALRPYVEALTLVGRLDPRPGRSHYRLPDDVELLGLPYYERLTRPHEAFAGLVRSLGRFWRALDDLDAVWLLGPYPHAVAFALLARLRGVPVVLGVRQDTRAYMRSRHPGRRGLHALAAAMEALWRLMARRLPVVVVGPGLERRYRRARALLPIAVSLVREGDIRTEPGPSLDEDRPLRMLSVGRVDHEKNPLLLCDVLERVRAEDPRWRLVVCGDGPLLGALEARLSERGLADHADLLGYVPLDGGLGDVYRDADLFLHVSWTEGLPQVLFEAFAAARPVVATAVGGVPGAAGDAALLVGPGDAAAAAAAVLRVASDPALRDRLVRAGTVRVRGTSLEHEAARTAAFLAHWAQAG